MNFKPLNKYILIDENIPEPETYGTIVTPKAYKSRGKVAAISDGVSAVNVGDIVHYQAFSPMTPKVQIGKTIFLAIQEENLIGKE